MRQGAARLSKATCVVTVKYVQMTNIYYTLSFSHRLLYNGPLMAVIGSNLYVGFETRALLCPLVQKAFSTSFDEHLQALRSHCLTYDGGYSSELFLTTDLAW